MMGLPRSRRLAARRPGPECTGADEHRDLTGVEHVGCLQKVRPGQARRLDEDRRGRVDHGGCGGLQGLASASAIWMSVGIVRCATPLGLSAWRTARSTSVGVWAGTRIISL